MAGPLPTAGLASTYADKFVGRDVADSTLAKRDRYTHEGYTAALLGSHKGAVPFGTRLRVTYQSRTVVVRVNDSGDGVSNEDRVLDLSRAAMAYLIGKTTSQVTNRNAAVITLSMIMVVDQSTPLGPVGPSN